MDERGYGDLLDLAYEAAVAPSLWIPLMDRLADSITGGAAVLSRLNLITGAGDVDATSRVDPTATRRYFDHYALRNPLSNVKDPDGYIRTWTPCIITDEDWMPKEKLVETEFYNDFLKPQDIHSTIMIRLAVSGYDVFVININRSSRLEQFAGADLEFVRALHPHLVRAFSLGRKFSDEVGVGEGLGQIVDRSSHGVFLLDAAGRVRRLNPKAEALVAEGDGLAVVGGRLRLAAPDAQRRFEALIGAAAASDCTRRGGGSMALPTPRRRLPLSLAVAPVKSERFSIFNGGPSILVCVTDLEADVSLPEQRLRDLFGLSRAEARVALALFDGADPRQAAANLELSFHTVRGHLVHIFEKTQTTGQADLARLMMRTVGAGP